MQGTAESRSDQNLTGSDLIPSDSGPSTATATVKRKAESDYMDEPMPVKKIKPGHIYLFSFFLLIMG